MWPSVFLPPYSLRNHANIASQTLTAPQFLSMRSGTRWQPNTIYKVISQVFYENTKMHLRKQNSYKIK